MEEHHPGSCGVVGVEEVLGEGERGDHSCPTVCGVDYSWSSRSNINGPGVAGAVLQTPSGFTCHMPHVICHVSHVMCNM